MRRYGIHILNIGEKGMSLIESENAGKWEALMKDFDKSRLVSSSSSSGGARLMLRQRPEPYRIRMISVPKVTRRHWEVFKEEGYFPVSPAINNDMMEVDIAWGIGGWKPSPRFTAVVMNRDEDCPAIMEFGRSLFLQFTDYMQATGIDPAGRNSPDFMIRVEKNKDGLGSGKWSNMSLRPCSGEISPLTDIEMSKASYLLKRAVADTSAAKPEQIRDMWMSLPKARRYSQRAVEIASNRSGYGQSSEDEVRSYIKQFAKDIFVPVLDKGKIISASIADMDPVWAEAYSLYYVDFGIRPNRYLDENEALEEVVDKMVENMETRWINPNDL
jgi:hypothetical protein